MSANLLFTRTAQIYYYYELRPRLDFRDYDSDVWMYGFDNHFTQNGSRKWRKEFRKIGNSASPVLGQIKISFYLAVTYLVNWCCSLQQIWFAPDLQGELCNSQFQNPRADECIFAFTHSSLFPRLQWPQSATTFSVIFILAHPTLNRPHHEPRFSRTSLVTSISDLFGRL